MSRRSIADYLEAERSEDGDPFELELSDGSVVVLPHPRDIHFKAIVGFDQNSPAMVLRAVMGDETFDAFANDSGATMRVLEGVLVDYYAHYGLGTPGEGSASSRSLSASARRSKRTSRAKVPA